MLQDFILLSKMNHYYYFMIISVLPYTSAPNVSVDTTLGEDRPQNVPDLEKALVLIESYSLLFLPLCYELSRDTNRYLYTAFPNEQAYHFCPPPRPILGYEDCIFAGNPEQSIECELPVAAIIHPRDYSAVPGVQMRCSNGKGYVYSFSFQPCKITFMGNNIRIIERLPVITMYNICQDRIQTDKVIWIQHKLRSPTLLTNENLKIEREREYKISTYDFGLFSNRFVKMSKYYEELNSPDSELVKQFIVSPKNMAFSVWKRPTYHIINTMPVLKEIAEFLNHVDEFLRTQASSHLGEIKILDYFRDFIRELPTVWIKVVYNESGKSGIAIVIHNTKYPPEEKLCESICDNYNWKGLIIESMNSRAYCCEVNKFAQEFEIPKVDEILNLTGKWKKFFKTFYYRYQYNCPYKKFTFMKYLLFDI